MSKIKYKVLEKPLKMLFKVEISEKTAAKEESTIRLSEIDIIPEKTSFWSGNQSITILRKPSTIRNLPDNSADAFVQQIATVLDQLTFKLDFNGMPLCVEKQDELWRKWLDVRANVAYSYTGDWIDKTLCLIDQKMLPSDKLTQNIMQDLFLNEYFRGIYSVHFSEDNFKCQRTAYGICPFPLQFNEKWTLQSSINEQMIKFSGRWNEHTITEDFNNWIRAKTDDNTAQVTVDGFYQVSNTSGWCNALHSSYVLTTGSSYEKTIKVTLTTN